MGPPPGRDRLSHTQLPSSVSSPSSSSSSSSSEPPGSMRSMLSACWRIGIIPGRSARSAGPRPCPPAPTATTWRPPMPTPRGGRPPGCRGRAHGGRKGRSWMPWSGGRRLSCVDSSSPSPGPSAGGSSASVSGSEASSLGPARGAAAGPSQGTAWGVHRVMCPCIHCIHACMNSSPHRGVPPLPGTFASCLPIQYSRTASRRCSGGKSEWVSGVHGSEASSTRRAEVPGPARPSASRPRAMARGVIPGLRRDAWSIESPRRRRKRTRAGGRRASWCRGVGRSRSSSAASTTAGRPQRRAALAMARSLRRRPGRPYEATRRSRSASPSCAAATAAISTMALPWESRSWAARG
mmetsp:Transcript_4920/g.16406  ORF Transcript_4920/g.16406 Transcript_4920/m.16406 type:complete len:351 (-) Transcript_4920:550-1602(-)